MSINRDFMDGGDQQSREPEMSERLQRRERLPIEDAGRLISRVARAHGAMQP